jgi:DNA-binding NtrC family response regulator
MMSVRDHSHDPFNPGGPTAGPRDDASFSPAGPSPRRLNLLLSYAGWRSESWVDQLPRLLEPMGVQSLRAGTGRQASDLIQANPIHIAVVDLGLPLDAAALDAAHPHTLADETSEGGCRLLELLARLQSPPPTVVVKRGRSARDDSRELSDALRHGAFAVIDRPSGTRDLELLLEVLRRALSRFYAGRWPLTPPS